MTVGGQNRKGSKVFISNLFMYFFLLSPLMKMRELVVVVECLLKERGNVD